MQVQNPQMPINPGQLPPQGYQPNPYAGQVVPQQYIPNQQMPQQTMPMPGYPVQQPVQAAAQQPAEPADGVFDKILKGLVDFIGKLAG